MVFHPAVEHITIVPALDPLWLLVFTAVFAIGAALAVRRPVYAAALLAFVVPFACAHAAFGTTITLGKAALLGTIAGLCSRREPPQMQRVPRAVAAAFAAVIAVDLLSGIHAQYHAEVIRETLKWAEYALYFAAVFVCYSLDPHPRILRAAIALSVAAAACSAFADLALGAASAMLAGGHAIPRIAGTLEGPNQLGGYLEIAVAVLAAWQMRDRTRSGALVLAIAGVALALCFSRAALIGAAVALIALACIDRRRIVAAWTLAAGVVAGYAIALLGVRDVSPVALLSAALGERASDVDAAISGGVGSRSELWRAAILLWKRNPLIGIGAGNYQYELGEAGLYGVRTQANEWYLQSLAEGGVLLLLAVAAWLASLTRLLLANARRSAWSAGALAATCAMVLHGFSDDLVFYPKVAELWMTALALGCVTER